MPDAPFPGFAELSEVSARIGADPLLIQGPGGNTSIKFGDALWVKASGVWLAEAMDRPVFAGISLASARSEDVLKGARPDALADADLSLRPSIEAPLHALMPHAAVVHAHAVHSMTLSVLADGRERAARALDGLKWLWIDYAQPGETLARAVKSALSGGGADILLLQNHGVVTGAATPREAEALLREVERRLSFEARAYRRGEEGTADAGDYEPLPALAPLANDAELFAIVTKAPLFPDQVVFLGGAVPHASCIGEIGRTAQDVAERTGVTPALILVPGAGAYGRKGRNRAADALMNGLYEVARRVPEGIATTGLSDGDAAALLTMEAEAYRIKLAEAEGK